MPIRAITFDFWGTLYHNQESPSIRRSLCIQAALAASGRHDITPAQIDEAMRYAWNIWDRVWREECRTFGAAEWLALILNRLSVTLPTTTFAKTVRALETADLTGTSVPVRGVMEVLVQLAPLYRLGIVSDTGVLPGKTLRALLKRDGLLSYFSHCIFSDEFGSSKPRPVVFLSALDRLDVLPHQAIHVGDLLRTDIAGARSAGMRTVRFAGIRDDRAMNFPDADAVIKDYADLRPLLETWRTHD